MNFLKFRWTSLLARLYVQIAVANHEDFAFHTHKKPGWWTWYAYVNCLIFVTLIFDLKQHFIIIFIFLKSQLGISWMMRKGFSNPRGRYRPWLPLIMNYLGGKFQILEGKFAWFLFFDRGKINKQWWQDPEIWHDLNK